MREPKEVVAGLVTALTTPLGAFASVDDVRREVQHGELGRWTARAADGGVVLAQVRCQPGGLVLADVLRAVEPPETSSLAGAEAYCARVASVLEREAPSAGVSMALLRATDRGLEGWVAGGVWIARLDDRVEMIAEAPTMELMGRPLLTSGVIASGAFGGRALELEGARFAVVITEPPFGLHAGALGDVVKATPKHLLARIAAHAGTRPGTAGALVAVWTVGGSSRRDISGWLASSQSAPKSAAAPTWTWLLSQEAGLAASCLESLDELERPAPADPHEAAEELWVAVQHLAPYLVIGGPARGALVLSELADYAAALVSRIGEPFEVGEHRARAAMELSCLARACGTPLAVEPASIAWLEAMAGKARWRTLPCDPLLALAHRRPELALELMAGRKLVPRGLRAFTFDLRSILRRLASPPKRKPETAIASAWSELLDAAAEAIFAGCISWGDLVIAAVVVHHVLGSASERESLILLGDELRARAAPAEARELDLEAGHQRGSLGFARARVRFETIASGLSLASALGDDALPPALRDAFFAGAREAAAGVSGVRITILSALVHPVDATPARFHELGARAIAAWSSPDAARAPAPPTPSPPAAPDERAITWRRTDDATQPYEAQVDGARWQLRLGDFPDEPMYVLMIDGVERASFDAWPARWRRPS